MEASDEGHDASMYERVPMVPFNPTRYWSHSIFTRLFLRCRDG